MSTIQKIIGQYSSKIDILDLELIIAHAIKKSREFVLSHPEFEIISHQSSVIIKHINRRAKNEPLAYILGYREFYGLDFIVNKDTLIPRPETELMVEQALNEIKSSTDDQYTISIVDIGTGSGNIIISLAKNIPVSSNQKSKIILLAIDISKKALSVARKNSRLHKVDERISFLEGNLLKPLIKELSKATIIPSPVRQKSKIIILANLPYLSTKIYGSTAPSVKNFEPRKALVSNNHGLNHYEELLKQIKQSVNKCYMTRVTCIFEFSPEQKSKLENLVKNNLPQSKVYWHKDYAQKWRFCQIDINT